MLYLTLNNNFLPKNVLITKLYFYKPTFVIEFSLL